MTSLTTVVIPTYNGERFIRRAIASAGECPVIVVDDGSTDGTAEIAKDAGAQVYHNKKRTGGPNKGRNEGAKLAETPFVCFLDQDDMLMRPDELAYELHGYHLDVGWGHWFRPRKTIPPGTAYRWVLRRKFWRLPWVGDVVMRTITARMNPFEERHGGLDYGWQMQITRGRPILLGRQRLARNKQGGLSRDPNFREAVFEDSLQRLTALLDDPDYGDDAAHGQYKLFR